MLPLYSSGLTAARALDGHRSVLGLRTVTGASLDTHRHGTDLRSPATHRKAQP